MSNSNSEECVDVVIAGSGSAGCATALWLAIYNDRFCRPLSHHSTTNGSEARESRSVPPISYRVLESREGRLKQGQADGVQCRTVEIYESFGLGHVLRNEGYWVNELAFWAADDKHAANNQKYRDIVRTGRAADVLPGLSHQPHLILNQARINALMLDKIKELKGRDVDYSWKVTGIEVDQASNHDFPVKVYAEHQEQLTVLRAKYVLGAEGAHSPVRKALNIPMEGDSTNAIWGVMDVFPRTTFPDIRKKTTIRSDAGTMIIIPREGDIMIRCYLEMPAGTHPKSVKLEELQDKAKDIFKPYDVEFIHTAWWSAYSIGQRVARNMVDSSGRVFLAGDASHTHSPKAGQGMNASLQDGYNIGWKLGALLTGQVTEKILKTYIQERHEYAKQLIDFDRTWAAMFKTNKTVEGKKLSAEDFNRAFIQGGVFTAGMGANYQKSFLTNTEISTQSLAKKVIVGERLPSAQVVRMSDSKPYHLQSLCQSDGRWRLIIFAGDFQTQAVFSVLDKIGEKLSALDGLTRAITPDGMADDSILEYLVVVYGDRNKAEFDQYHAAYKPRHTSYDIENVHKIYFDDESWNWGHGKAYENLGIEPSHGCMILVRPDQYVSAVVSLHDDNVAKLKTFFNGLTPV